jgi:hypothetical protein
MPKKDGISFRFNPKFKYFTTFYIDPHEINIKEHPLYVEIDKEQKPKKNANTLIASSTNWCMIFLSNLLSIYRSFIHKDFLIYYLMLAH